MAVSNEVNYALKMLQYMRAGVRVNSRVKVVLEWGEKGQTHTAEGYTVDISPKGCLAIVPHAFTVGQRLSLTNAVNGKKSQATLIWRGHEERSGWELGLELNKAEEGFWEVEF